MTRDRERSEAARERSEPASPPSSVLAPPSAGRFLHPATRLKQLGLRPRKGLSQAFLADQGVARAIVQTARLDPAQDEVLEVGPGLGVLTERLVGRARRVVALELDRDLAAALPDIVAAPNLEVVQGDVLAFAPDTVFAEDFVVVANLPYHITSAALRHLLAIGPPWARRLVVMMQKEVAERIAATAGEASALSTWIQAQATVEVTRIVPRTAFYPPPKVHSAVVRLLPRPDAERRVPRERLEAFMDLLHAGFAQPRKVLGNSLAQGLAVEKPEAVGLIEQAGLDPRARPQALGVTDWVRLFELVSARA